MTRPPTAAQRRIIDAAEPVTGRVTGTGTQLAALVKRGLAFRHPRPPHDHFLTPAGHRAREETAGQGAGAGRVAEAGRGAEGAPASTAAAGTSGSGTAASPGTATAAAESGVFAPRIGGEEGAVSGPARIREVHGAWQGLLELRRMTNHDGTTDRPCGWERTHLVQAAALALEAGGHRPAGPENGGYRVRATPQPEAVAVHEPDPDALRTCAVTLEKAGWQVSEHTDPRTRERYLLASPRRT